jgi:hypothetical protein
MGHSQRAVHKPQTFQKESINMTDKTQAEKVAYWTAGYHLWNALMGKEYPAEFGKPQSFEDSPCAGFWRKGVYDKQPNKAAKRVGWEPVAIWIEGGQPQALVGAKAADPAAIWTSVCKTPISEDWYRAVAERGEGWPDDHRTVAENPDPDVTAALQREAETPAEKIAREIAEEKAHLPKYSKIESDEQSSKARSLQQRFLDLRGEAKRVYEDLNAPLLKEQKRIREIWFPLRDGADEAANVLRKAMEKWEDTKREAARRAAAEQERITREHAAAALKAKEANEPPPPMEAPKPNTPPPAAQIRGGPGRAAAVKVEKFVTEIDVDKVFQVFKERPEVVMLLSDLAQKAIRAGLTVDGATWEEKSVIR